MNDVILPLYHIYHCVFVPMEHYCQLRQMSTRYQVMSQTLPCLYASEMWYRFDGYLQILSSIILFVNPNLFSMPNRLTGAPYFALGNYAIYAYLICLTHVPNIMMAVHQTPFNRSCVFFKFSYIENIFQFSIKFTDTLTCNYLSPSITYTIIFTFSIIPHFILFVKYYFSYTNNQ